MARGEPVRVDQGAIGAPEDEGQSPLSGDGEPDSHSLIGDDLIAVLEPGDLRPGEAAHCRQAEHGGPALHHRLPLLLLREVSHVCRESRTALQKQAQPNRTASILSWMPSV